MQSHPSWVCGLKPSSTPHAVAACQVTPFVGVWIETGSCACACKINEVTPFVGVWIETLIRSRYVGVLTSHPSWVCGLKLSLLFGCDRESWSHPSWVCGLKQDVISLFVLIGSHTLRGCVDWNQHQAQPEYRMYRHTLRGCVDWNIYIKFILIENNVTPFVGVWIETLNLLFCSAISLVTPFVGVWIETK